MNPFDPSKMDAVEKARLTRTIDRLSLASLLAALLATTAGFILYLVDSSLIYTVPWAILAATLTLGGIIAIVLAVRDLRRF